VSVDRVRVEADGGARGNPGPAGYGAVVLEAATGEVLAERSESLGVATNNVAEYSGLIAGLAAAADLGARSVDVRMDSKLVVEQMSGRWKIKHPGLRPLAAEAAALVRRFDEVTFAWIPRERNKRADALANAAMDAATGASRTGARSRTPAAPSARPSAEPGPDTDHPGSDPSAPPGARPVAAGEDSGRATDPAGGDMPAAAGGGAPAMAGGSWEPRTATPTRLVLVRHGETPATEQRRWSGRADVDLSPRGREQAGALAARLAGYAPVAAVLTSPLRRCADTAATIAEALGTRPQAEPDLAECDFGDWDGRTFGEVRARWPRELAAWQASTALAPPGGESMDAVAARVRRVVRGLLERYPGQTVVVVSHVSPIKLILRDALAAGDGLLHRLHLDAAGVSVVDTWTDGGVSVRTVNDTAHLATG
jgi:broad specificity phosphatase PhoE/ribonuclease HI